MLKYSKYFFEYESSQFLSVFPLNAFLKDTDLLFDSPVPEHRDGYSINVGFIDLWSQF